MKVGLFDHVELSDRAYATTLDERLAFAQAADEAGIWCLHVAEHHASPLNMVPVPGVYLGALARLTKRLRMGPLVLSPAALFAAAAGGRNLHARSSEQGPAGSGRRARRVAVRARLPQDQARGLARHFQGRLRVPDAPRSRAIRSRSRASFIPTRTCRWRCVRCSSRRPRSGTPRRTRPARNGRARKACTSSPTARRRARRRTSMFM